MIKQMTLYPDDEQGNVVNLLEALPYTTEISLSTSRTTQGPPSKGLRSAPVDKTRFRSMYGLRRAEYLA